MPGVSLDGTDTVAVYETTREAVARARRGEGPSLIEVQVSRMLPHSSQDDDAYRTEEEREAAVARDPLPRLKAELLRRGLLTEDEDDRLRADLKVRVTADADRAWAQPQPEGSRARRWLYAGDAPHSPQGAPQPDPEFARGVFEEDDPLPRLPREGGRE
jgi:pyruvate dehydrogenase E1 component alpha subunit